MAPKGGPFLAISHNYEKWLLKVAHFWPFLIWVIILSLAQRCDENAFAEPLGWGAGGWVGGFSNEGAPSFRTNVSKWVGGWVGFQTRGGG